MLDNRALECAQIQPCPLGVKSIVLSVSQGISVWSQRQEYLIIISKQKPSEEYLCQLDANETKPFWDGEIDLIFSPLLQIFAMTEWHTLHSATQAKGWLMTQWRSNSFPAGCCCFRLNSAYPKWLNPKFGFRDDIDSLSRNYLLG